MLDSFVPLKEQKRALLRKIAELGDFRPGSITATTGRCGDRTCHCHQAGQAGHGPNFRLTFKAKGKTVTESLSSPAARRRAQDQIARYRKWKQLSADFVKVNTSICRSRPVEKQNQTPQQDRRLRREAYVVRSRPYTPANSFERALICLDLVGEIHGGLTYSEIRHLLNIPKSSCSYIVSRLDRYDYLRRDEGTGRYELGPKLIWLANAVRQKSSIRRVLVPILRRLVDETTLTSAVAVLRHSHAVIIAHVTGFDLPKMNGGIGHELPFEFSAAGKAIVGFFPPEEMSDLVSQRNISQSSPDAAIAESKLRQELETVREQGYATAIPRVGARSMAVPIFDVEGAVCASIVVLGTTSSKSWKNTGYVIERLKAAAQAVSSNTRSVDWEQLP